MRSCACTRVYACRCVLVLVCTGTCTAPGNVYPGGAAFMQPHHPHHLSNQHPPPHHPTQLHALAPPADLSPNMPPGANNLGLNSISPLGQPPYRAPLVSRTVHASGTEPRLLSRKHYECSVVRWFSNHVMKKNIAQQQGAIILRHLFAYMYRKMSTSRVCSAVLHFRITSEMKHSYILS